MWSRGKILTATGLFLLPLLFATALGQGDDKPIVQNTPPGRSQKIPNLPDCITPAAEQGHPTQYASVLMVTGARGCTAPWPFHAAHERLMRVGGGGRGQVKGE